MTVLLLPRLTAVGVSYMLETSGTTPLTAASAKAILSERSSMTSMAASGGSRSEEFVTAVVGAGIRGAAERSGFPYNTSQNARSKFDQVTAIFLASLAGLATGESLRDDVWSYIATVVVPDIVSWRFSDRAMHRFQGGVRNALQRLWVRGVVLDRGEEHSDRWGLLLALTEDAAVQIFERASIGGNRPLAMALAEGWANTAKKIGREAMEPVMRRATKIIRLRNEVVDIGGLDINSRNTAVMQCFDLAIKSLKE